MFTYLEWNEVLQQHSEMSTTYLQFNVCFRRLINYLSSEAVNKLIPNIWLDALYRFNKLLFNSN